VPARLRLDEIIGERLRRRQQLWRFATMIALGIGLGGIIGWYLRAPPEPGRATSATTIGPPEAGASVGGAAWQAKKEAAGRVAAALEGVEKGNVV